MHVFLCFGNTILYFSGDLVVKQKLATFNVITDGTITSSQWFGSKRYIRFYTTKEIQDCMFLFGFLIMVVSSVIIFTWVYYMLKERSMFITCWLIYKTEEWQMNMLHMHLSSSFTWHMRYKFYIDVNYKTLYFMEKKI